MEKKNCKVCGVAYECNKFTPADVKGVCHICESGMKSEILEIKGLVGVIYKSTEQMLEKIEKIEKIMEKDLPPARDGRQTDEEFIDEISEEPEDFDLESYDEIEEIQQEEPLPVYTIPRKKKIMHLKVMHDGRESYSCNFAVITTPDKYTKDKKQVTCSNCLRVIRKMNKNLAK